MGLFCFYDSCGADCTARMWTLGGRYLQTLGSFKPFEAILLDVPPDSDRQYSLPADIKRFCSSTTFKVLTLFVKGEANLRVIII